MFSLIDFLYKGKTDILGLWDTDDIDIYECLIEDGIVSNVVEKHLPTKYFSWCCHILCGNKRLLKEIPRAKEMELQH